MEETADAHSVSFAVPEGAEAEFDYKPGQFLTLAVPSDQTGVAARCYSLSSSPHDGGPLTVTVKRTADGYASNWICDNLREGSTIRVLPPSGIFTPATLDADLLLFAGGSGITPIMSITRTALAHGTGRIVLFYANRDETSVIFAGELAALAAEHPHRLVVVHWLESVQGLPTQEQMKAFTEPFTTYDAFVCGPAPFMKLTIAALRELEFPRERRHQEKFISLGGNPFGDPEEQAEAEHELEEADSDDAFTEGGDAERRRTRARAARARRGRAGGQRPPRGRARRRDLRVRRLGADHQAARAPGVQGREGAVLLPRGRVLGLRGPAARGRGEDAQQRRARRRGPRRGHPAGLPVAAGHRRGARDVPLTPSGSPRRRSHHAQPTIASAAITPPMIASIR